jgi:hypothetical protein
MTKYYPIGDLPTAEETEALGATDLDLCRRENVDGFHIMAEKTGEIACPKAGEWYLSGAIPTAYRMPHDCTSAYHMAKLVLVERRSVVTLTRVEKE